MRSPQLTRRWLVLITLSACLAFAAPAIRAGANDGIFPPSAAAKASIDFDGGGFLIHGRREFIASGSLHYPRVPRALWHDRLLRIKRAGFNCVETYAFWNLHEPQEGKWDFSGEKDLDAFLKEVRALGLYSIVRVGPYVCAEWDSGGYPVWLRFKKGIRVREDNAPFEAAVDRWYEKVIPIVAANQIHRGGAVIMVQLENEHPQGWGTEMPNPYFRHLRDKALSLGLEVPYFFSGLHHGSDPAGDRPWSSAGRVNPWFSTEFWPGWYDLYGPLSDSRYEGFVRGNWKILAYGGNGYNFYMLHGGTDFDTWNDDEVASCYDYGAAIGQAGDLRPIFYAFKHAALFARSFPEILESAETSPAEPKAAVSGEGLRFSARKSPSGEIEFLDNSSRQEHQAIFADAPNRPLTVLPGEIRAVVRRYTLTPDVTLTGCTARILGVARQGTTTSLVIFGTPGKGVGVDRVDTQDRPEPGAELTFSVPTSGLKLDTSAALPNATEAVEGGRDGRSAIALSVTFPAPEGTAAPVTVEFQSGGQRVRVIALSYEMAQRTWLVDHGPNTYVVCGPESLGETEERNGRLILHGEAVAQRGYSRPTFASPFGIWVYPPTGRTLRASIAADALPAGTATAAEVVDRQFPAPVLSEWEVHRADGEARPDYLAGRWKFGLVPPPMGSDGDTGAYAWYRTTVRAPRSGTYSLGFSDSGDWITVFVNGTRAASSKIQQRFDRPMQRSIPVALKAGENTVAVFAAHYGRHKLFNFLGPISEIDAKGLSGPVYLSSVTEEATPPAVVRTWRWRKAPESAAAARSVSPHTDASAPEWGDAKVGDDVFQKQRGFAWYFAVLPALPGAHHRLHFQAVDDNATVFLNGKRLAAHRGWSEPFDVKLDSAWTSAGPNELLVLVENVDNVGGISGNVELTTVSIEDGTPVQGWRERGGIGDPSLIRGWAPLNGSAAPKVPCFYRADFTLPPAPPSGPRPTLRLVPVALSRGFVWLNGHNLGRYPEKTRAPGIYLPECWLKPGTNTLAVFDEEGLTPAQAHIEVEAEASRYAYEVTASPEAP